MQSTRQQNNQTTKQPDNTNVFLFIDILSLISCLRNFGKYKIGEMKKLIILICLTISIAANAIERDEILKVYNWADYIDEELIPEFEKWYHAQTGKYIHVSYSTFDINESMLTEIEVGHEDYDVVCPSEYIIERMLRKGLLQPINKRLVQSTGTPMWYDNVAPFAVEKFQQMAPKDQPGLRVSDYTVGYMWGTTGFMYNKKYLKASDLQSWMALFNPRYIGKILMKDAFRDVYSCLVCFARYDDIKKKRVTRDELVENITDENIALVENLLKRAKPNIFGWEVDFGKETMTKGKAWANFTWSGDAAWAMEEAKAAGVDLGYVVPKEGSNVWFDGWVIPKYAKNPDAASYFIDFMCKSENAIRNMEAIGYVSVIGTPEVLKGMIQQYKEQNAGSRDTIPCLDASYMFGEKATHVPLNPVYYPDKSVIERCALMHDCADKTEAMVEMWSRVKGDSLNVRMIIIITTVLAAILITVLSRRYRRRKHLQRRRRRLKKLR